MKLRQGLCFFLFVGFSLSAQSYQDLERLARKEQSHLDTGYDMLGTVGDYSNSLDSIMNITYKKRLKVLSPTEKQKLIKEQREWLKKADELIEIEKRKMGFENDMQMGTTDRMIMVGIYADYIKDRIMELIYIKRSF